MRKSLVKYQRNLPAKTSGVTLLIGALIIGVIIWFLMKGKTAQASSYTNAEEWNVTYSEDGLPTKIVISRHAIRK